MYVAKPHTRTTRRTQVTPNPLADFLAARLAFFSTAISTLPTSKPRPTSILRKSSVASVT
jgi:hypothetical protein